MSDASLYEMLGRKTAELEMMHTEYTKLLSVLEQVVTGVVPLEKVQVHLESRSWAIEITAPPAEDQATTNAVSEDTQAG